MEAMKLAMRLGWVQVDEMLDQISPYEFLEWVAFMSIQDEVKRQKQLHDPATAQQQIAKALGHGK